MDFLQNIDASWTLFLDRDGVINKRIVDGYVENVSDFHFLPFVPQAISLCKTVFGRIFVVTNQQGIGKGIMTEEQLSLIHTHLKEQVPEIDAIYHSPYLACENNAMRKPNIGMAVAAKKDYPEINFQKSIMVGDSQSDIDFGKNAGMFTVFVSEAEIPTSADLFFPSLFDFASAVVNKR
ncbi:MAG: HAD-IIIA family hydrolase [Lentimicrobiaceae bacterium]|nr:HAD-IIIA family hydrolase [Lentimicrobiaceae bacterium]